jgi:glycogen phosphorylase
MLHLSALPQRAICIGEGERTRDGKAPMSNPLLSLLPTEVEGVGALAELALDLRWSWNHAADDVRQQLDPTLWALTHNPWVILPTVSRDRLKRLATDPAFRQRVEALCHASRQAAAAGALVLLKALAREMF